MKKIKVLCLGDSLTEGYAIEKKKAWPELLNQSEFLEAINAGISGDMTAGMLSRLPLLLKDQEYDHVMIMGGTNDVEFALPNNQIISNIKAIMRQLRYLDIAYTVLIPLPFDKENSTLDMFNFCESAEEFAREMDIYSDRLRKFLIEDEAPYIDLRSDFRIDESEVLSEYYLDDGVHPNEKGHRLIRKRVFKYFDESYEEE
jgi:lysophospholipase L1-like esterase